MRIVIAAMMLLHGTAHLVGFMTPWRLISPTGATYRTTVLSGRVDLGDAGIRAVGVLWLITAAAFWIASAGAFADRPWWVPVAIGAALVSLCLSVAELPDSRIGVPINIALLAALLTAQQIGRL